MMDSNNLNKKKFIIKEGIVLESLPSVRFRVKLDNGEEIIAYLSGKLRKFRIKILPGDKVRVELASYDEAKTSEGVTGRIVYRLKI